MAGSVPLGPNWGDQLVDRYCRRLRDEYWWTLLLLLSLKEFKPGMENFGIFLGSTRICLKSESSWLGAGDDSREWRNKDSCRMTRAN